MNRILDSNWCSGEPDYNFASEVELDNCVSEKILRNKFHDPLISSDSEDDSTPEAKIDWDEIFKKKKIEKCFRSVVLGLHSPPPFPKLSALTSQQHYQCLKVLCTMYPDVMPADYFPRPTKQDYKTFESLKEVYEKEQKEFREWAQSMWTSDHCVRALRPKPQIELVYEAEFMVRANAVQSFPKTYELAAQIRLESQGDLCEIVQQKELIKVNISAIPMLQSPDMTKRISIMEPCPIPEPCSKHPYRFVLPSEKRITMLPLTEINKVLAQYAIDNKATAIVSENALRCLVQWQRAWCVPLSVCEVFDTDAETHNVIVLGSEFSLRRDSSQIRTYKAFRRLLEHSLVPPIDANEMSRKKKDSESDSVTRRLSAKNYEMEVSDDEEELLFIDTGDIEMTENSPESVKSKRKSSRGSSSVNDVEHSFDFYNCTCKGTKFEHPPPRSFRRWRARNTNALHYDFIVHCTHTARNQTGEVILEPIPEYQIDLGGSEQGLDHMRGIALAMMLRKNASVLNVRIDSPNGDIVTTEAVHLEELQKSRPELSADIAATILSTLHQLQELLPGNYLLVHEASHGGNCLLYCRQSSAGRGALVLECDSTPTDEATALKAPPTLAPVLLPVHKHRRTLPCAFTPYPNQVVRAPQKPVSKQKTPPQAIQWPKRRGKKKKSK